jgi:xylan 1,4-beta-xylosidase
MPFVRDLVVAAVLGMALLFAGGDVRAASHVRGRAPLAVDGTSPMRPRASTPPGRVRPDDTVRVDLTRAIGPVNRNLTGVVWNAGGSIVPLAPVHPAIVRIDGSLESRSQGPGQLDLQPLLNRVAQVRAIGAEPLVILSYMPRWLGEPRATGGQDPTRMGPYDLDAWQDLITQVVRALATAPQPAYRFEVWNEPDIFIFWLDTPERFVETALRTHQAVADVKRETGLPLQVGGPAAAFGLNDNMLQYLRSVAAGGLPLDFVTWHNYANSPFLGPDGPEGNLPEEIYQALARRNPDATPLRYSAQIGEIRAKVDAALAGSGLSPALIIDEWNVSAGGYDVRHDTAEGASFDAGILVEMERAGLDGAAFYRAVSGGNNHIGDWGLVYSDGTPKPSWWVFRAWWTMTGDRLPTSGDDATGGLWARATRDGGRISVLLTNFVATGAPARTVEVDLDGKLPQCRGKRTTTLATLDGSSTTLANPRAVQLRAHKSVTVPMGPQSVALLQISCSR